MFNGKPRHVVGAVNGSPRRGQTAYGVHLADTHIISSLAKSAGTIRTRKKATTRQAVTTMPGKVDLHQTTTGRSRSPLTEIVAYGAVTLGYSFTTRMVTERTRTQVTWKFSVSGATSWLTAARTTYQRGYGSSYVSVPVATRDSDLQGQEATSASPVEELKQRYSQCLGKLRTTR